MVSTSQAATSDITCHHHHFLLWQVNEIIVAFIFLVVYIYSGCGVVPKWIFLAVCVYIQAMDQPSSFTINRMFIVSFFFSGSATAEVLNGKRVSVGGYSNFQLTLIIQYVGAGICKVAWGDWLYRVM